jgi:lysyl-tRNA synthetase class 2
MTEWRPTSGPRVAASRAAMLRRIRAYFEAESVLEVDTPALADSASSDTHIESLQVASLLSERPLYLHTSPEYCMKRLLAAGYPDIYSICRVFRDGEAGRRHQPEFTLVEWYRKDFGLQDIIADTLAAIATALDTPQLVDDVTLLNYRDAFLNTCGLDPARASIEALADVAQADDDLRRSLGESRDDWLDLILSTKVAATFAADKLTVLQHYPASQAALARLCPDDPDSADRFEVFMGATELANGYVELRDSVELKSRIEHEQRQRHDRGLTQRAVDHKLVAALHAGLPACAGVAMGLERLQMLHAGTDNISDVITFSFEVSDAQS